MTLLLLGAGAVAAVLGTRAAGLLFLGAAVVGGGSVLPAVAAWTAGMAAGLTALKPSPRRLALPVLGAAAAVGAGSARNTAVVLALWVLATGAAVLSRGPGAQGARWAATLCACDLPVVAAVAWVALRVGFEEWPRQLDGGAVVLLLAAAAIRASLAAGPSDDRQEAGLLTVRAQTAVLLFVALGVTGVDRAILIGVVLIGAAGFALSGWLARPATRDVVQEIALVALVVAGARLNWMPSGWEWGALAAGTLIHNLRLRLDRDDIGPLAAKIFAGGGIGLPLLPVVLVGLEGAARARGWQGVLVLAALVAGLGDRLSAQDAPQRRARRPAEGRWERVVSAAILGATVLAGLWSPVLAAPRPPGGEPLAWPPIWALGVVVAAAGIAATRPLRIPVAVEASGGRTERPRPRLPDLRLPESWARPALIRAGLIALAAVAVGIWVVGVLRGFL